MKAGILEIQMSCFYNMYWRFVGKILQIIDRKLLDSSAFWQSMCHYLDSRGLRAMRSWRGRAGTMNLWLQRHLVLWAVCKIARQGLRAMECVHFLWWIYRHCSWYQWILSLIAASMGVQIRRRWLRPRSWRRFLVRWCIAKSCTESRGYKALCFWD